MTTSFDSNDGAPEVPSAPSWVGDVLAAAAAVRALVDAQIDLLGAELRLARRAARLAVAVFVAIVVFAVAFGLSLVALLATALAQVLTSWPQALLMLAALLLIALVGSTWLLRQCLHWMTLPASRAEWRAWTDRAGADDDGTATTSR